MMTDTPQESIEFVVVTWCGRDRGVVRDYGIWCGCGNGGFERQIHETENVSNHEHLQLNHNIDHHHKRKTPCAALYDE